MSTNIIVHSDNGDKKGYVNLSRVDFCLLCHNEQNIDSEKLNPESQKSEVDELLAQPNTKLNFENKILTENVISRARRHYHNNSFEIHRD